MKTLALVQGDLSPAAGGYLLHEGPQRIHQDLSLALREDYGGDSLHPGWGSVLQRLVGQPLTAGVRQQILVEINRVLANYITVQNARIAQDNVNGTASKMTTNDIVTGISGLTVKQVYDSLVASVVLQTVSRQQISISQVIG